MSEFGWIDYDPHQSQAMRNILARLRQREARDELGIGAIRDAFADLFFPGTSTVHRRLRYLLFVPWCMKAAEQTHGDVVGALKRTELTLLRQLRHLGEGAGVIGLASGETLQNWPSSLYWTALRVWGIYKGSGSLGNWPVLIGQSRARYQSHDDEGEGPVHTLWDPDLPRPPKDFLKPGRELDFTLEPEEISYLRRRLDRMQYTRPRWAPHNLLRLFDHVVAPEKCAAPWQHPKAKHVSPDTRDLLRMAKAFSESIEGASILYNLELARLLEAEGHPMAEEWVNVHDRRLRGWGERRSLADIKWLVQRCDTLFDLPSAMGHTLTVKTREFVAKWLALLAEGGPLDHANARRLVREREIAVKKPSGNSRFASQRARNAWGGSSGVPLVYRWEIARTYLRDLGNV